MGKNFFLFAPVVLNSASKFLIPAVLLPFVAQWVGIEQFGRYVAYYSVAIVLSVLVDFSTAVYAPITYAKRNPEKRLVLIQNILLIRALVYIIILIILYLLRTLSYLDPMILILFVYLGGAVLIDFTWLLITENMVWKLFISSVLTITSCSTLTGYFLFLGNDHGAIISALTMPFLFSAAFTFVLSKKIIMKSILCWPSITNLLSDARFASKSVASQFISSMYSNAGPIICAYHENYALAGIWAIVNRLVGGFGALSVTPLKVNVIKIAHSWSAKKHFWTAELMSNTLYCVAMFCVIILAYSLLPKGYLEYLTDASFKLSVLEYFLISSWLFCTIPAYLITQILYYNEDLLDMFLVTTATLVILVCLAWFASGLTLRSMLMMHILSQVPVQLALITKLRSRN